MNTLILRHLQRSFHNKGTVDFRNSLKDIFDYKNNVQNSFDSLRVFRSNLTDREYNNYYKYDGDLYVGLLRAKDFCDYEMSFCINGGICDRCGRKIIFDVSSLCHACSKDFENLYLELSNRNSLLLLKQNELDLLEGEKILLDYFE